MYIAIPVYIYIYTFSFLMGPFTAARRTPALFHLCISWGTTVLCLPGWLRAGLGPTPAPLRRDRPGHPNTPRV